jgi:hypothetical protein
MPRKMSKLQAQRKNLILAKVLFFATAMSGVGWTRFQNNFYLDNGLSSHEIGALKSIGLLLKIVGKGISLCMIICMTTVNL